MGVDDCNCGANGMMLHSQTCAITPIYASLVPPEMNMIIGSFHAANAILTQSIIKCAECGRELLGRDADVIYSQPPMANPATQADFARNTKRIVKAVCPSHNRRGRIGYQRQAWAGY